MKMKNFDFFAKEFTLKILMLSLCGILFSCADIGERDNPVDPGFDASSVKRGSMTDARDGQTYKTVTIGKQTWMAENLNFNYNEGSAKSYCYDDKTSNCDKYGRLYTWSAAMDSAAVFSTAGKGCGYGTECKISEPVKGTELVEVRGVCPEGWHLPNDDEWDTLFDAVGGTSTAGTKLKSTSGWNDGGNGTDSFGFAVLPAGYRDYDCNFSRAGYFAYFWSSTESHSLNAYRWYFYYSSPGVTHLSSSKGDGFSVRCLRDSEEGGSSSTVILSSSSEESSSGVSSSSSAISYGTLKDSRDNQTYKTVTIGTQTWMAENLNYDYNEGSAKSYCYDDDEDNCDMYGRLYTWAAAMDSAAVFSTAGKGCGYGVECKVSEPVKGTELVEVRGVCPEGWHLPNVLEWRTLFKAVGGADVAGIKLKSTSGWYNSGNGVDSFGFSVLPAGCYYSYIVGFISVGYFASFWSSTEYDSDYAYSMDFYYDIEDALVSNFKRYGFSVRCLRDSEDGGSSSTVILSSSSSSSAKSSSGVASSSSSSVIQSSSSEESSSSIASSSSAIKDGSKYDATAKTLTDLRDNQTYKTVTIGTQTWMAENLNYDYKEGTAKSYCYNNSADSCAKYGRLYLWSAAMDSAAVFSTAGKGCGYGVECKVSEPVKGTELVEVRGVCPEGWHLPSYGEWQTLFEFVGGEDVAGRTLKSTSGWYNSGNGVDSFGFSVFPAGYYSSDSDHFGRVGSCTYFWSSTEDNSSFAYLVYFYYDYEDAAVFSYDKYYGFSVRCLRDSN